MYMWVEKLKLTGWASDVEAKGTVCVVIKNQDRQLGAGRRHRACIRGGTQAMIYIHETEQRNGIEIWYQMEARSAPCRTRVDTEQRGGTLT